MSLSYDSSRDLLYHLAAVCDFLKKGCHSNVRAMRPSDGRRHWRKYRIGRGRTSQVHAGLQTLPHATRRAVFPADLVDDAVVPAGAKVVVLTWRSGKGRLG